MAPLQSSSLITKKNKETVVIEKRVDSTQQRYQQPTNQQSNTMLQSMDTQKDEGNMLEVIYDPVLNCYYDPQTNSYYELKSQ